MSSFSSLSALSLQGRETKKGEFTPYIHTFMSYQSKRRVEPSADVRVVIPSKKKKKKNTTQTTLVTRGAVSISDHQISASQIAVVA